MSSHLNHFEDNTSLDSLFELCLTRNDQQINLIVKTLKLKGINLSRAGDIPNSIVQF